MCLIVYSTKGSQFPVDFLRSACSHNPHGFGVMWAEGNGRIGVIRGLLTFDEIHKTLVELKGTRHAFHLRYRTHGLMTHEQCHPFEILGLGKKPNFKQDLYMMHNGILHNVPDHHIKSDSQVFAELLTKRLTDFKYPDNVFLDPRTQSNIRRAIGAANKLLFMFGDGRVEIVNESAGTWFDDLWCSNLYSFSMASNNDAKSNDDDDDDGLRDIDDKQYIEMSLETKPISEVLTA